MSPQMIVALVIAALGFGSGWEIQAWRYGAKENRRAQQELADERSQAAAAIRRQETVINATVAANNRELVLRRDADRARSALGGLRGASASALQAAGASLGTCLERANTFSELLDTSAERYRALAEKADRHANDAQTCHDGWPK